MKTATVRVLRNRKKFKMPDIAARLRSTYGNKIYDATDLAEGLAKSRGEE